jgi:DNA-binding NarL/FixJ family response regulator
MKPRIVIADDHALMLEGLKRLLSTEFEVVGIVTNGRELFEEAEKLHPDVILLDVAMPGLNGIEVARKLTKRLQTTAKLVFVTQHLDPAYVQAAIAAGAHGYVAKQSAPTELVQAIRMAIQGQRYITPLATPDASQQARGRAQRSSESSVEAALTTRQREVLPLVAEGKTSKEISSILNISVKTVEFHRNSLMDVLGVRTVAQLTAYAISHGIVVV